jgi:hypothetical protein
MKKCILLLALSFALAGVACDKKASSVFEDTGKKVDQGIHNAGENIDNNLNKAGEKVKDATH